VDLTQQYLREYKDTYKLLLEMPEILSAPFRFKENSRFRIKVSNDLSIRNKEPSQAISVSSKVSIFSAIKDNNVYLEENWIEFIFSGENGVPEEFHSFKNQ